MKIIDISEHQGSINWDLVKGNVDGVMIRAGYGRNNIDKQFLNNVRNCNRLGIPCGAYWFSYAYTVEMATLEAQYLLAAVKPFRMELPLAFDFEYDSVTNASNHGVTATKELVSDMTRAFCYTIEGAGYYVLNYSNPDYLNRYFDDNIKNRFGLWLAQWPLFPNPKNPPRMCAIWQYSSKGTVPGINTKVDMNEGYVNFADVIVAKGLNNLKSKDHDTIIEWGIQNGFIKDESDPITWEAILKCFYKLHGPEDNKNESGLLS